MRTIQGFNHFLIGNDIYSQRAHVPEAASPGEDTTGLIHMAECEGFYNHMKRVYIDAKSLRYIFGSNPEIYQWLVYTVVFSIFLCSPHVQEVQA